MYTRGSGLDEVTDVSRHTSRANAVLICPNPFAVSTNHAFRQYRSSIVRGRSGRTPLGLHPLYFLLTLGWAGLRQTGRGARIALVDGCDYRND